MSRYFTKFAAALLLLIGFAGVSNAQETTNNDIIRPITKQGSAAFLFTFQGLGTFGLGAPSIGDSLTGAGFVYGAGMKYYIADDLALRVLLAFNNMSSKASDTASAKPGSTSLGIGVGAEMHFRPLYSTSPYVGAMINFANWSYDNDQTGTSSFKQSRNSFGINVLAGFDWFWTRGLAIGAEYGLGFATYGGTNTSGGTETSIGTRTSIAISGGGNVHLVVYF